MEDGDPKGFQSSKGKAAKEEERIQSWKLPPRTPEWMPLDFSLWAEIQDRLYRQEVLGNETKKAFLARLRRTAMSLPKSMVERVLAKIPKNIDATVQAKGKHIDVD